MKNPMPRLCHFAGYMLGACAQVQGPNAPAANLAWRRELAAARLAKFRLVCEVRMLFDGDDLPSNSPP